MDDQMEEKSESNNTGDTIYFITTPPTPSAIDRVTIPGAWQASNPPLNIFPTLYEKSPPKKIHPATKVVMWWCGYTLLGFLIIQLLIFLTQIV